MKQRLKQWGGVSVFIISLLLGCRRDEMVSKAPLVEQDTLVAMIEKQIAKKKLLQKKAEQFRRKHLPQRFQKKLKQYYPIIRKYSKRYGIDWRLIVVQIMKESRFKENARSNVGAMGLMQIMPRTAREITRELDIENIAKDPRENIAAGIYHMYKQFRLFSVVTNHENRARLALAAYNCGAGRIYDARDIARFKKMDPDDWEAVRACLPLLTSDSWKLHLEVWEQGTPSYGYFYGYEETVNYVDFISEKYQIMKYLYSL